MAFWMKSLQHTVAPGGLVILIEPSSVETHLDLELWVVK